MANEALRTSWLGSVTERVATFAAAWPGLSAALIGLVAACGFPPLHAWWVALPALALLVAHIRSAPTWRGAAWRGWMFGWAHLTLANNWIATAFTHQAKMPEFLGWLAVPLLCVYLAIYPALAAMAAHLASKRAGPLAFGAVFAAAWIVSEWVRSWAFTGYPWPPLGLVLLGGWDTPGVARVLPWIGTYALSGLAAFLAAGLFAVFSQPQKITGRKVIAVVGFCFVAIINPMVLPAYAVGESNIQYTLVQPLITQDEINDGSKFEEQFQRIAGLTLPGQNQSRVVFWPESAIPDYLEDGYPERYYRQTTYAADPAASRERVGRMIGPQSTLLTGVVNLDIGIREDGSRGAVTARNSVIGMNGEGDITHHYAKAHLVPYGEYLPLEWALGYIGLERLVAGSIPYQAGPGPKTLDLGEQGKAGVQICYEIVFSGQVVDRGNRPDYLFNPSNDGWFGSWGPPQHLGQARMRAIEEGLPVLRSTTTGISAVIDASGVVREHIPMGVADKREGIIPAAHDPTLFAQLGNALPLMWAALLAALGIGLPRLLALRASRG